MPEGGTLPYFIEMLRTIEWGKEGLGANYVPGGSQQFTITQFPPLTEVVVQLVPRPNIYAYIFYAVMVSPQVVPNSFYFEHTAWGSSSYNGPVSEIIVGMEYPILVPCTSSKTVRALIRNLTPYFQYFELGMKFLIVPTEENYKRVVRALEARAFPEAGIDLLKEIRDRLKPNTIGHTIGGQRG